MRGLIGFSHRAETDWGVPLWTLGLAGAAVFGLSALLYTAALERIATGPKAGGPLQRIVFHVISPPILWPRRRRPRR